jgi:hypothetical protein
VCEPVLAEAMHLLARLPVAQYALMSLFENGALSIGMHVEDHVPELRRLLRKYQDQPMSLADACIVRMPKADRRGRSKLAVRAACHANSHNVNALKLRNNFIPNDRLAPCCRS